MLWYTAAFVRNDVVMFSRSLRRGAFEAPRVHYAARRRGRRMADGGACAADGNAGGPQQPIV
jgi:hypothetical protein